MKKIITLLLVGAHVYAQVPVNTNSKFLDKNMVKARIYTVNNKFCNIYGSMTNAYEVPKGKGRNAMGANSIWIGGMDAGGKLHEAANTYRQTGNDYWPGPLDTVNINVFNPTAVTPYNDIWSINCDGINDFVRAFNNGFVAANTYPVPSDILEYPGNGTGNFQRQLAPYFDANGDGIYNPQTHGDYPLIKGQQQIYSVFNDANGLHSESGSPAMGLEIHERSYVYSDPLINDTMQAINYTTFYNYTIYNRSDTNYYNVFITDWADVDLGYALNDLIGTDTVNHFVYAYNGGATEPAGNGIYGFGYGNKPPVLSHVLINTPSSHDGIDNNHNGVIDEPGEQFLMDRTTYYNNNTGVFPPATSNPLMSSDYYNYMTGFWIDGSPFSFGGTGYGGSQPSRFVYPGNPQTNTGWTEGTAGNIADDRRFLMSSGPFNFPKHSKIEWGYAIVFSRDTTQAINTITEFNTRVRQDVKNIKYYDDMHQLPICKPAVGSTVGIKKENIVLNTFVYPNPAVNFVNIDLSENVKSAPVVVTDLSGRKIMETQITDGYHTQIDVSLLDKGIYFIEVNNGSKRSVEKLIKH